MTITRLATAVAVAGLTFAGAAQADGIRFFPALEKGFKLEPTLAVTGGITHAAGTRDDNMGSYGIDFNMNCGLLQTPANRIRTHVQINRVDESGIKATSFELSPRYTLPIGSGFSVGAGPVIGSGSRWRMSWGTCCSKDDWLTASTKRKPATGSPVPSWLRVSRCCSCLGHNAMRWNGKSCMCSSTSSVCR